MNAAGIDVSKGKSMVSVMRPFGEVVAKPSLPAGAPSPLSPVSIPALTNLGDHQSKSVRTSKSGPPELRKALFLVMDCLIQTKPQDDPVYQFMDKKRAEGKPYLVYMTAGANKFLRIYYGKVKEYLAALGNPPPSDPVENT